MMQPPTGYSPKKKGMNPLTVVLLLSSAFFALFILITGALFLSKGGSSSKSASAPSIFSAGSVGVLELNGVIMDSKKTLKQLERFEDDGDVKAVVLRLNSPGGSVAPSQEIYEAVKKFKKPIVASMASVAASGAYYVAMGAKKVYANPGTITGSIGVIMEFMNLEKLYDWAKVRRYTIKTGRFKDVGSDHREMTPDERALLQAMIDDVLKQFKQAVAEGRKLTMEQVTAVADGRIFSGSQAKAAKLVDELGTLQDAVNEAAKMAKIKGKPNVVYAAKPRAGNKLLEFLLDDGRKSDDSEGSSRSPLEGLLSRVAGLGGEARDTLALDLSPGIYWLWKAN